MIPAALAAASTALSRRLDPESVAPVTVGLSGGSDSLALLHLAQVWASRVRRPLVALSVDHGLHPDSAAWTQAAGAAAARLGVAWRPLAWTGPKPAVGLPAAARQARHALLAEATRAVGACVLLLGHTADDVAESELIRAETPTHGRLAEWSPSPAWPQGRGVFVLRPLLSLRRAELQAWLLAEGLAWLDDPANADLRFARSRARATLDGACAMPAGASSSSPLEQAASDGRRACWTVDAYGGVEIDRVRLAAAERPQDILAKALLCVSGGSRPPSGAALARLSERLSAGQPFTSTLAGTQVGVEARLMRLTRELGRTPPAPVSLTPGVAEMFDGRFEVAAHAAGWRVAPLAGRATALPRREREALRLAPADVRRGLPALLGPDGEVRLAAPFGRGPADARSLVGERLAAALGLLTCERACGTTLQPAQGRGAASALILS